MGEDIRIDKWLWHARFYRTRPLAQEAARCGLIRLNGQRVEKAGVTVAPGDMLTVPRGREVMVVRVRSIAERRGSATEARLLYEIEGETPLDPPVPPP